MTHDELREHAMAEERTLGRLEGGMERVLAAIEQDRADRQALEARLFGKDGGEGVLSRMAERIGALERWRTGIAYAVGAVTAGLGWVLGR